MAECFADLSLLQLLDSLLQGLPSSIGLQLSHLAAKLGLTCPQLNHVSGLWVQLLQHLHKHPEILALDLHDSAQVDGSTAAHGLQADRPFSCMFGSTRFDNTLQPRLGSQDIKHRV